MRPVVVICASCWCWWASLGIVDAEPAEPPRVGEQAPDKPALSDAEQKKADEKANKEKEEKIAEQAASVPNDAATAPARPQVLAVRGGSLGIPSPANTEGVLAGVDVKGTTGGGLGSTSSVDAFAKVGGLDLGRLRAEVIGETFDADIPVVTLSGMPAVPLMTKTAFSAVGIRARYNFNPTVWASRPLDPDCVRIAVTNPRARDQTCDEDIKAITTERVYSVMAGMRLARRGSSDGSLTDLGGVEWEVGLRVDSDKRLEQALSWSLAVGVSGLHVNEVDSVKDGVITHYVRMNDIRVSVTGELRRLATKDVTTASLGIYGVLSQDFWTNKFHVGGDDKVRDYQLESGVYVSGVMKGFSGLIMLSVIKPYAHASQNIYAISLIPFGGAVPTDAAPKGGAP